MKKISLIFFYFFLISLQIYSQINLFEINDDEFNNLTNNPENSLSLTVDQNQLNFIKENKPCDFYLNIPFFDNDFLKLELELYNPYSSNFQLIRSIGNQVLVEDYNPKILSYRILGQDKSGIISFLEKNIVGTIKINGKVYELKGEKDGPYILFDISDSVVSSYYECQTEDIDIDISFNELESTVSSTECVEMGIDTDYFTFLEFDSNCYDVVEWALAVLAGVSEIYMQELDEEVLLQARYINVRESEDNYYNLNDCADMLDELGDYWTSNPLNTLQSDVDLVHLFTRKQANGGIAWVDAFCNTQYKYGVSSGLNTNLNYDYPNNTPFSYNMSYVGHEVGHNFGANHTHWCGWDADETLNFVGGAIDSCYPVEGDCFEPGSPNNGTMMSYCDLAGISSALQFHPIVKSQALFPNIFSNQASCFGSCGELETSCEGTFIYGCTSENSDNYNPEANVDDGSCYCESFVEFYLETDFWSSETSWEITNDQEEIIYSGSNYSNGGITIDENLCLQPGCYEFSIFDSYGDGLSSNNTGGNNPNYYILDSNGASLVLMTNTNFGNQDLYSFCITNENCNDTDGDGVCDENEISGCQNTNACNYDSQATDPGECIYSTETYLDCNGLCLNDTDSDEVCNVLDNCPTTYNPNQEDSNGNGVGDLCENVVGCTDETACNYNQEASIDCNCCTYPQEYLDCDGNCLNDINENDICDELEISGCIDSFACNYNQFANTDDGSCEYENECNSCTGDLTCFGCTDKNACNFNLIATIEDNSCIYPNECSSCTGDLSCFGCTDENACNFNLIATIEDNSCIYPIEFYDCNGNCLFDLDNDSICDELDNCITDFNPNQIDSDNDGYGDVCSCEQVNIVGETLSVEGSVVTYDVANQLSNNYSWSVVNGEIIWDSATDSSVSVLWGEEGVGTVIITQIYGDGLYCDTTLDVVIIPNSVNLEEEKYNNEVIKITDILGRDVSKIENNRVLIIHYIDGKVEKIYNAKK